MKKKLFHEELEDSLKADREEIKFIASVIIVVLCFVIGLAKYYGG